MESTALAAAGTESFLNQSINSAASCQSAMTDSRKRGCDSSEGDLTHKKTNMDTSGPEPPQVHLKILVPCVAAGAIIGKGGETIAEVQKSAGVRIKMSKANDTYPGTNERVCLITGSKPGILSILDFINEKIREKPDPTARPAIDFDNKVPAEREKQVKALIPNSTAGMIIGKGGAFIKQLKEESGAFIQLSQKAKDTTLSERVATVIGDPECLRKALDMILDKIRDDPQSGSCLNISYSDSALVANPNPTGSPFAQNGAPCPSTSSSSTQPPVDQPTNGTPPQEQVPSPFVLPLATGGSLSLKFNFNPGRPPTDPSLMSQYLGHMALTLRNVGYLDRQVEEVSQAINCLASHGILVVNLNAGGRPPAPPQPPATHADLLPRTEDIRTFNTAAQPTGFSLPTLDNGTLGRPAWNWGDHPMDTSNNVPMSVPPPPPPDPFRSSSPPPQQQYPQQQTHQVVQNRNSFGLGTNPMPIGSAPPPPPPGIEDQQQQDRCEIEINECIIGAVIGPSGRSIVDIQNYSGARIQISKKGQYSPGTRNRIVTIAGPSKAITTAKFLIEKKILEEENKRDRQSF